jgi:hypothetical protein
VSDFVDLIGERNAVFERRNGVMTRTALVGLAVPQLGSAAGVGAARKLK